MITLYSTGCPNCRILKDELDNKSILYEVNENIDEMIALGISTVPVLCVDGKMLNYRDALDWVDQK